MRLAIFSCLVACGIFFVGCGGGSAPGPTASAPPEGTPPPDGTTPMPGGEGTPAAQLPGDTPPNTEGSPQSTGTPDGATPLPEGAVVPPDGTAPPPGEPAAPENTPAPPPRPKTIREQAIAAFQSGDDAQGMKHLNAHYAFVPAAKDELPQKMGWYAELKRPALAPRIGIAVHYSEVPTTFRAHPMPIGSAELTSALDSLQSGSGGGAGSGAGNAPPARASGRRGARGEGGESAEPSAADTIQDKPAAEQLAYYLGEFGESLLDALQERMETGEFGPVLQELAQQAAAPPRAAEGQTGENTAGTDQAPPPPSTEEGRPAGRTRRGGASAATAEGVAAPGGDQPAPAKRWSAKSAATKDASATAAAATHALQLSPCVIWLGKGTAIGELNKRAEAADIDVLAVFSLSLKENRTGVVNNSTTLRIHNLRAQKLIPSSPEPLANVAVHNKRKKDDKSTDPVESEILKALTALDTVLKPAPLPATITADVAKKRIAFLVGKKPEEPLPVIVEARLYATKGFMTEEEFQSTAKTLLGEDGFAKLTTRATEDAP